MLLRPKIVISNTPEQRISRWVKMKEALAYMKKFICKSNGKIKKETF